MLGAFVTPRVMGRYLKMHPFIVTVSVVAGAQIFGPAGALLALPGAAMLQTAVGELTARLPGRPPASDAAMSGGPELALPVVEPADPYDRDPRGLRL